MEIKTKEFFYISNILSSLRIILIIPILYFFQTNNSEYAIGLIVIAALTDYLDGLLSRKLKQVTELGKILDPIADKLIMGIILLYMVINYSFPFSLVLLLIYRDILILFAGLYIIKKYNISLGSNIWGKLNTTIFAITALLFLLKIKSEIITFFLFLSYISIIVSSISYYKIAKDYLKLKNVIRYTFILIISE